MTSKNLLITLLILIIMASIGVGIFLFYTKYSFPINDAETSMLAPDTTSEISTTSAEIKISQKEIDKLPGCVAALAPIDVTFSKSKKVTNETKSALENYRKGWQDLCLGLDKSKSSLYLLWVEAQKLTHFGDGGDVDSLCIADEMYGECIDITLHTPGIDGKYAEGMLQGFAPSQKLFAENVLLGTQEDKNFFNTYVFLNLENSNNFQPWIRPTWDYGGCVKYGSYDWVATLKTLDELSKKMQNPRYLEEINSDRNLIINFNSRNVYDYQKDTICTCDKKEVVLTDLEKILEYSKNNTLYKEQISGISKFIGEIKNGKVVVSSEAERHCSGG